MVGINILKVPEPYIELNPIFLCADAKKDLVKPVLAKTWASIDPKVVLGHQAFYSDVVRHAPTLELTVRVLSLEPNTVIRVLNIVVYGIKYFVIVRCGKDGWAGGNDVMTLSLTYSEPNCGIAHRYWTLPSYLHHTPVTPPIKL